MNKLTDFLTLSAAPFLTLFFIPLAKIGGFEISLNFLCILALCLVAALHLDRILSAPGIVLGILGAWLAMLVVYLASSALLGYRHSITLLAAQIPFILAAIGLSIKIYDWHNSSKRYKYILYFCLFSSISFFVFLVMYAPSDALYRMIQKALALDPAATVHFTRRVFSPSLFVNDRALVDMSSYQNRVAQHLFAHAFLFVTLCILIADRVNNKLYYYTIVACSFVMMVFSVIILSGQALANMMITVFFAVGAMLYFKTSYRLIVKLVLFAFMMIALLAVILSTDLWITWSERFTGGNIDTGRTVRWSHYFHSTGDLSVLGLSISDGLDPHNLYVGALYEGGIFAFVFALFFAVTLIFRSFYGLGSGTRRFGLAYVLMMSVGLQTVFVTLIAGGWGYPGWAEWSKFSLFVLGVLLLPRFVWSQNGALRPT